MSQNKFCLLTYTSNEDFFFPIWHEYYKKIFNSNDIFIINNNPENDLVEKTAKNCNIENLRTEFNQDFYEIFNFVQKKSCELLEEYDGIYIAESDEILYHPKGLINIANYYLEIGFDSIRPIGYEPVHDFINEKKIDENKPILKQRKNWREAPWMRKIVFVTEPIEFCWNMHNFDERYCLADFGLTNIHLKFIDYEKLKNRNTKAIKKQNFNPKMLENKFNWQNRIESQVEFDNMFNHAISTSTIIPDKFKNII